jgi:hypothetical protein
MNSEQVLQKAAGASFNSGRRSGDHFVEVTETVPRSRQLGPRRQNGKCAGVVQYPVRVNLSEACGT